MRRTVVLATLLLVTAAAAPDSVGAENARYFGAGLGMPYGTIGVNVEGQFGHRIGVTGGLGHTVYAGLGWCVGARAYFRSSDKGTRPRVSVNYGTAFITDVLEEQKAGLSLGVGARSSFGRDRKHGIDYDLLVIAAPSTSSVEDEWGGEAAGVPVKIAIGYSFRF